MVIARAVEREESIAKKSREIWVLDFRKPNFMCLKNIIL